MLDSLRRSAVSSILLTLTLLPQSGRTGSQFNPEEQLIQIVKENLATLKQAVTRGDYRPGVEEGMRLLAVVLPLSRPGLELSTRRYLGAAQLGAGRYRDALETLVPARDLAVRRRAFRDLWSIDSNIAWVYLEMNNPEAAARFADQALTAERACGEFNVRPIISRAFIYAYTADFPPAERLFSEAIDRSFAAGDVASAASAWHLLGVSYLKAAQDDGAGREPSARRALLARAEIAETEAFRLRTLHHLTDLDQSRRDLARILAERGDLQTAEVLMEEAVASMGNPRSTAPIWYFLSSRGQLRVMRGDLRAALPDLRAALELARRLDVVPTDDDRITFESGLADLFSLFIDAGNRLYLRNHDPQLKGEVFQAAEESRAASLRALVPQPHDWRTRLPAAHADVLARLQRAERTALEDAPHSAGEDASGEEIRKLRASLHDIESRAGAPEDTGGQSAIELAKRALDGESAILEFHLGSERSWVWAITRETFEVSPLAPRAELAAGAALLRRAIQGGTDAWRPIAASLAHQLFDPLPASVHRKRRWIVALDRDLFDLPLPALLWNGRFLVEDHALLLTPGVLLQTRRSGPAQPLAGGKLIGVGDAIYNAADNRWASTWSPMSLWTALRKPRNRLHLARLPGSGDEVRSAVAAWGNGAALTGSMSTRENVLRVMSGDPAILHLATHVIPAPGDRSGMVVLGMNPSGELGFLDMRDILLRPLTSRLVVMSGCASGDAAALPASGLMGLTRAWLGAGADEVLATRWPALDDNGRFFSRFYRNLRQNPAQGAAEALHRTQVEMIRSQSFRSSPEYWASYFLVGRV